MSVELDVLNTKGDKTGTAALSDKVFGSKVPLSIVHEVVTAYLANQRRGTHSTKTRGEVSGGGLKPWKQKHTGRARAGSTRSPLWRHGGIIFGPKPRSYNKAVPASKRRMALRRVLTDLVGDGRLTVVDNLAISEAKTKRVAEIVDRLGLPLKTLILVAELDPLFERAARNHPAVRIMSAADVNSYDVIASERVVATKKALEVLTKRLETVDGV